jgi:fructose transport system ATP-binding protein
MIAEMATVPPERLTGVPVHEARGLIKRFGQVTALAGTDFDLYPGEVLGVSGDNGAGKSALSRMLCGADKADEGEMWMDGEPVTFQDPLGARSKGIETVYQNLAVSPALDDAANLFLGRERRRPGVAGSVFRLLDRRTMELAARDEMTRLGLTTIQHSNQTVETLSGGP